MERTIWRGNYSDEKEKESEKSKTKEKERSREKDLKEEKKDENKFYEMYDKFKKKYFFNPKKVKEGLSNSYKNIESKKNINEKSAKKYNIPNNFHRKSE